MVVYAFNTSAHRQTDLCNFEATLDYIVSSWSTRATE